MKNKSHLGKGIHALLSIPVEDLAVANGEALKELDVNLIVPNPFQPRISFDNEALEELKRSIEEKGVIQPILVTPINNGGYQLVAGERRLRATKGLGIKTIPAYIKEITSDEELLEIALIENVQREQLNPVDLARGYQQLIDDCGLTQEDVAKKIGKNRTTVSNVIRLLKLPEKIQKSLEQGEIREGHARALLRISEPKEQGKIWQKTVKDSLSVRSVEQLARKFEGKTKPAFPKTTQTRKPAYLNKLESNFREKFGTQVKIRPRKDGGTIEIVFYSNEDLQRLIDIFDQIKF